VLEGENDADRVAEELPVPKDVVVRVLVEE